MRQCFHVEVLYKAINQFVCLSFYYAASFYKSRALLQFLCTLIVKYQHNDEYHLLYLA